jgi:hypothetical protein
LLVAGRFGGATDLAGGKRGLIKNTKRFPFTSFHIACNAGRLQSREDGTRIHIYGEEIGEGVSKAVNAVFARVSMTYMA